MLEKVKKMANKPACRGLLIFDGECRLCMSVKTFLEKHKRLDGIQFIPYKSLEACRALTHEYKQGERPKYAYLIQTNGVVKRGMEAFLPLMAHGRMRTCLTVLWKIPGVRCVSHRLYHLVACHRYQWFGAFTQSSFSHLSLTKQKGTEVETSDPEPSDP